MRNSAGRNTGLPGSSRSSNVQHRRQACCRALDGLREFSDGEIDWGAAANETDALTEAAKKVQAAAEREEEIQEQVKEAGAALVQIKYLRKGGSGRPPKNGSKSTTIYAQ